MIVENVNYDGRETKDKPGMPLPMPNNPCRGSGPSPTTPAPTGPGPTTPAPTGPGPTTPAPTGPGTYYSSTYWTQSRTWTYLLQRLLDLIQVLHILLQHLLDPHLVDLEIKP